jgi:predicted N-formylglutamate amidohydrolase
MAEGRQIALNRNIDDTERERRLTHLWRPYHDAIDRAIAASSAHIVFAIHSFTPIFAGVPRDVQIGVLFDEEEELAERARRALLSTELEIRMNEPYSGREGLIYSARHHAIARGRRALELEIRQDLATDPAIRARVVRALTPLLREPA